MRRHPAAVRRFTAASLVGAAALMAAACGGGGGQASANASPASPAPAGLPSFYAVPAGVSAKAAGSLLKSEAVAVPGVDGIAYRVMYVSTTEQGRSAAVTGVVYVPRSAPPPGGFPVVSWAHGTNGMADSCAPSLAPDSAVLPPAGLNLALDRGWEVVASDYQGEGTPPHLLPYLVGALAGRNTIDIVRAARQLPAAHASRTYLVWGHSEGGQTAMFAWQLGPTYGSQSGLHLVGVVAGAPPSQFAFIYQALVSSPFRVYLLMAAVGFNEAYGDATAPLDQVLTPTAMSLVPQLHSGCLGTLTSLADAYPINQLVKADPYTVPAWKTLLQKNDPESFSSANDVPLLIIQGGSDEQIPVVSTQLLAQHLCGLGQDLERWIYPGQSHAGVIVPSAPDMVHWMADRFAGDPNPDPYAPSGEAGVQTTTCPS